MENNAIENVEIDIERETDEALEETATDSSNEIDVDGIMQELSAAKEELIKLKMSSNNINRRYLALKNGAESDRIDYLMKLVDFEADMTEEEAENAIVKTLEELPEFRRREKKKPTIKGANPVGGIMSDEEIYRNKMEKAMDNGDLKKIISLKRRARR